MGKKLVHTPEGVRDIYGDEYARKLQLENFIMGKVRSFGYEDIQTPTFEFFDVFSKEVGTTPSRELYKFFDRVRKHVGTSSGLYSVYGQMCRQIFHG